MATFLLTFRHLVDTFERGNLAKKKYLDVVKLYETMKARVSAPNGANDAEARAFIERYERTEVSASYFACCASLRHTL